MQPENLKSLFPTDEQVREALESLTATLGNENSDLVENIRNSLELSLRTVPLLRTLAMARQYYGFSQAEIGQALGATEDQVKQLESPISIEQLDSKLLLRYVDLLELGELFGAWCDVNSDLAFSLLAAQDQGDAINGPAASLPLREPRFQLQPGTFAFSASGFEIPVATDFKVE